MKNAKIPQVFFTIGQVKDLILIQKLGLETFRNTYEHLNEPEAFADYIDKAFSINQLQQELEAKDSCYYLLWNNEACMGYFKLNFGKAKLHLPSEKSVELERIYLHSSFQGKGFGQNLIQKAESVTAAANYEFLWLGVWSKNPKAIRFYKKSGFSKFGEHYFHMGQDRQLDFLMYKQVAPNQLKVSTLIEVTQ